MPRVFSAPSKALLAGGYLVLDSNYSSFVTALSARMYAVTSEHAADESVVRVLSPQFESGSWEYRFDVEDEIPLVLTEINAKKNPFAEAAVHTVISFVKPKTNLDVTVTIFSDSGYHTQQGAVSKNSSSGSKTFYYHRRPIDQVPKTGLGSSAGLVTVLTTALLSVYLPGFTIDDKMRTTVHNLAQIAHCIAQKKIGSGFDVAAATYGSIVYRRFKPEIIDELVSNKEWPFEKYHTRLVEVVQNTNWNVVTDKCSLPQGIRILMGDVAGGSETPKLVSKVLSWRKEKPEFSLEVWTKLNEANMSLVANLQELNDISVRDPAEYAKLVDTLTHSTAADLKQGQLEPLVSIVANIESIRHYMRIMTKESGATIEPPEQTELLDCCSTLHGVLGGVVPGAGGYDAICLIVASDAVSDIVKASDGVFARVSWLDLTEQQDGIVEESEADFQGLY